MEGILSDTITKALSDAEDNKADGQETDISLSLATEEVPSQELDVKKDVETDSLDESEQHI